jgi:tetratricopeptide (TPR) repeat protein
MKITLAFVISVLAATVALSTAASAAAPAPASSGQYAQLAKQAGHNRLGLFYLEQAMAANVHSPARFGQLEGRYWALVGTLDAVPEAANFSAKLKLENPDNADVVANYANALGGLIGWLHMKHAHAPDSLLKSYNKKAMASYKHALKLQPDNFSALLGRSIHLSHTPGGMDKAGVGFKHILKLRKSHPHYPYALVYRQWAAALKRNGEKARAKQVMKQGHARLGDAAFQSSTRQ